MTDQQTDPFDDDALDDALLLRQVREVLTPMPAVNRRAIADILAAVAVRQPSRAERIAERVRFAIDRFYMATSPLSRGTALATLALLAGFVMRDAWPSSVAAPAAGLVAVAPDAPVTSSGSMQQVEGTADRSALRVPVQFVLDARALSHARTLSVVGDFNDWNVAASPMAREGELWSVSLPVTPGRHVYAFVVNGTEWIADPRAPRAADADFGRPGSVIIVQSP